MMFTRNEVCKQYTSSFAGSDLFCDSLGLGPSSMIFLLFDVVFHVLQVPPPSIFNCITIRVFDGADLECYTTGLPNFSP